MKLPKTKNKILPLVAAAAVVVLAAGAYLWFKSTSSHNNASPTSQPGATRKVNDVNYSPPTDQDKKQQDQQKQDIINQATNPSTGGATDVTVSISRASQADAGQPLVVRTIVSGAASGTCQVTLTKEGQSSIVKSFTITTEATYSTCANAQIAASDIPVSGQWTVQVVAKSGATTSPPASLKVTITK